ncbi:putative sac3 ganp nin1 mts3 eif-3 p25 [Diplodia seriata]|uniref:Putative sac3 ganp nin1 mts3 eif-3 p25 n=1 Tax=Diplodia seriata TaxID=420778 RepID=A0A0G2GA82_9PEZI|nr:putative sac3 ganp nin1 mts3 eif-3 p25 [Diplodia seriata]
MGASMRSTYTGRISTTQTDYFRLRALGINYEDVHGDRRGRKRYREFDDDEEAILSDVTSAPSTVNKEGRDEYALQDPTIAKARALQKSMSESIDYYRNIREQIERESSFRASVFPGARPAATEVPKYWSRESKFLPRSEYGGARWLANTEKGKGKAVEVSTDAKPSKPNYRQQVPSPEPVNSSMPSLQSFTSVVPDSNPFIATQPPKNPTPNGTGTQDDEIMILSSDDEDDVKESQTPIKMEAASANMDDDDELMEVSNTVETRSVAEDFESQYGQHAEFNSQFEDQYQYAQALETTEMDEDEVDPAILDEDDGEEDEEEGDDEDDDEEDEEEEDDEEIIDDEEDIYDETQSDDDSEERGITPNAKYQDKGNSFEDAIEL